MDKRCLGPRQTLPRVACYFCARRGRGGNAPFRRPATKIYAASRNERKANLFILFALASEKNSRKGAKEEFERALRWIERD